MKLFVTGGAGFIGSHFIADALIEGHTVVAVDNFSTSNLRTIERIKLTSSKDFVFHEIDICDQDSLRSIVKNHSIDVVVHFAAFKSVPESIINPLKYYKNNLSGSIALFGVMREFKINNIIFSSSASVYGSAHNSPIKENFPLDPISPYAHTKVIIESILRDMANSIKKFKALNLRYFNPVGCHETHLLGESPAMEPTNLFPVICSVAKGEKEFLSIFGEDYDTHDGTPVRDYIHISDLVSGHLSALEWFKKDEKVLEINLGTGQGYSVLDIVNTFNSFLDKPIKFKFTPKRQGDPGSIYADNSLAKVELNWNCSRSLLNMCEDSWHWYSKDF